MMKLSDYQGQMRILLGDENGRRFGENVLNMGLQEALLEYERVFPRKTFLTALVQRVEGKTLILSFVPEADQALYSLRRIGDGKALDFVEYRMENCSSLSLREEINPFQEGDSALLEVGIPHVIKGLYEASASSVPDGHALMVSSGAAGYALLVRARAVTEVFGKRPEDGQNMSAQGQRLIEQYHEDLSAAGARRGGFGGAYAETGWTV